MAKSDWKLTGFRLPPSQKKKLDAYVKQHDEYSSAQEYLHERVLEDIRDVKAGSPRDELKHVRHAKERVQDDIESVTDELDELREQLNDLKMRERELEERIGDSSTVAVDSYADAIEGAVEKLVSEGKPRGYSERGGTVAEIADEWCEEPMAVLRDIYEADPRVTEQMASPHTMRGVPDSWKKRVGEDRDEAVDLLCRYVSKMADDSGGVYEGDAYVTRMADAHDMEPRELLRKAVGQLSVVYEDVVFEKHM